MKVQYGNLGSVLFTKRPNSLPSIIGGQKPPKFISFETPEVIARGIDRLEAHCTKGRTNHWIDFGCIDYGLHSPRVEYCIGHLRYAATGIQFRTLCTPCVIGTCKKNHDTPLFTILEKNDWLLIKELARAALLRNYQSFLQTIPA